MPIDKVTVRKIGVAIFVLIAAACAGKPIHNVEGHAVPIAAQSLPPAKIRAAIIEAAEGRGWQVRPIAEGQLEATYAPRTHKAVVDILYDRQTYSIRYKSSENLKAEDGTIHHNYNRWVQNLDEDIQKKLSSAANK